MIRLPADLALEVERLAAAEGVPPDEVFRRLTRAALPGLLAEVTGAAKVRGIPAAD